MGMKKRGTLFHPTEGRRLSRFSSGYSVAATRMHGVHETLGPTPSTPTKISKVVDDFSLLVYCIQRRAFSSVVKRRSRIAEAGVRFPQGPLDSPPYKARGSLVVNHLDSQRLPH